MKIGIVNETTAGERRVALIPDSAKRLKKNHEVILEPGAGDSAAFTDEEFTAVGATVDSSAWQADVVLKIQKPTLEEIGKKIGLSRERVRQIEKRAKTRLKNKYKSSAFFDSVG